MSEHIEISAERPWVQVFGDGTKTDFHFDFPIFQDADLEVYLDVEKQTLGPTNDYEIEGAGSSDGGTVKFNTPPANEAVITMRRRLKIQRMTDFQESGEFRAKVINDELDYQTAAIRQIEDDVKRTLRLPATDPDATLELPDKATRAEKFLWFGPEGNLTIAAGLADIEISEPMESVVRASSREEALSLLNPKILKANASDTLEIGMGQEWKDLGSTGAGSITPLIANSNRQIGTVTGNFTLNDPEDLEGSLTIKFSNDAAGPHSPTFSGFSTTLLPGSKAWNATNDAINWVVIQREGGTSYYGIYNDA